jgi:hypothetical protein
MGYYDISHTDKTDYWVHSYLFTLIREKELTV